MNFKLTKIILLFFAVFALNACETTVMQKHKKPDIEQLDRQINRWHLAAANKDADTYFGMMAPESVFIGTDKTENWTKTEFENKYRPYFESGKSWDFKPIERNWYFNKSGTIAWFDETLDTWMGVCQSSGVLEKQPDGNWLIKHYQLSLTIDNDKMDAVIKATQKSI